MAKMTIKASEKANWTPAEKNFVKALEAAGIKLGEWNKMSEKKQVEFIEDLARLAEEVETEKPVETPAETSETPAENVLTDETPAETEKPVEKPAKTPKKTLKTSAEEMLKEAGIVPVKIDKKGRYYFKEFYVMFRKEGVRLHPSAKFRKAHEEVNWEFHPGWANEYATFISWEQIVKYVKASETEESAE